MLDLIWKMRDTIGSTFDAKALSPSHFKFSQRENSRIIDTEARYNDASQRWAVNRRQVGKKPRVYEFDSQNTLDPITAIPSAASILSRRPLTSKSSAAILISLRVAR
jgi:hypothetical protein